jgi:hypothetical protein
MDFSLTDVFNLWDILQRSAQHQALTPSERAWLKAYKGILHAVVAALLLGAYQFFAAHTTLAGINWQVELGAFGPMLFKAYLDARAKFFTAQAPAEVQTGNILGSVAKGNSSFQG